MNNATVEALLSATTQIKAVDAFTKYVEGKGKQFVSLYAIFGAHKRKWIFKKQKFWL